MLLQTPFHAYYAARMLDSISAREQLLPVYASSDIQVYPFQIAAASFALRSPYQKGVILCDEAGMGKSHEAMLVINQRWLEGQTRILLCIPNADLVHQWVDMLERYYSIPYTVLTSRKDWEINTTADAPNGFDQDGLVITTYDFAAEHEAEASQIRWNLTVFEEANALSGVYQLESRQAKALYRIAGNSFKLLLTGTPIEKNIMDLYGLIWFIDKTVLPDEKEFLARYLRKPENYPELAERVSRFCFRTLRSQAKQYAKVPERVLLTVECSPSMEEQKVYDLLYTYINKPNKLAFPEMDPCDLALRLLSLQSSSTAAIKQTLSGVIRRLEKREDAQLELAELQAIVDACNNISTDTKVKELLRVLEKGFALMKKTGAKKKAVIFTESVETMKMLRPHLAAKYKTLHYYGGTEYSVLQQFLADGEVLISTDNGAKGFHLADASFVIHYDLLYNTLKMEQRIDRCHRLGQQNDVLSVAFINKGNFADVRKLELVSKRMLVSDGVFGVSDDVIGGFTDDPAGAFPVLSERLRTKAQIETEHQQTLASHAEENKQLVAAAEDVLFTTFTKGLADKIKLSPRYIETQTREINNDLWALAKYFFTKYNETHTDCLYVIDEAEQTITATNYETLPVLFYYWNGSQNRKYQSQRVYGMAKVFKPRHGRITLSSIIGRGILHELECSDSGILRIAKPNVEDAEIGLYSVSLTSADRKRSKEIPILVGRTKSGKVLNQAECLELLSLPVATYEESAHKAPHWLKKAGTPYPLDQFVPLDALAEQYRAELTPSQAEEAERLKLEAKRKEAALSKEIDALEAQIKALEDARGQISNDRLQILALDKQINQLRRDLMGKKENPFFEEMRLDQKLEKQINVFQGSIGTNLFREFLLEVER
ncbi:MAG: hypothetical protein IKM73_15705 [Acidaminococcaceae bacterium]|nr:hypothetical protein [Acidaminococcaceae bacterium]